MPKSSFVTEILLNLQCFVKSCVSNAKGKITGKTLRAQTVMPSKNAFEYRADCRTKQITSAKYASVVGIFARDFLIIFWYFGKPANMRNFSKICYFEQIFYLTMLKIHHLYSTITDITYKNSAKNARLNKIQSGKCFVSRYCKYNWGCRFWSSTSQFFAVL